MDSQPTFRRNLLVSVSLAIIIGVLLSAVYLHLATERQAKAETIKLGDSLALQSEILIRPLILSNDRVSLNYLLNELLKTDHVSGLQVQDKNGIVIARAGDASDIKQVRRFLLQDQNIGTYTLWLDSTPVTQVLRSQHTHIAMLAMTSALLVLLAIWFTLRDRTITQEPEESFAPTQDFSTTLALETSKAAPQETEANDTTTSTKEFSSITEEQKKAVEKPADNEAEELKPADQLHTNDLVDLLKPEPAATPQMPKFEHQPQDQEDEPPTPIEETLVLEERNLDHSEPSEPPTQNNPLFKMKEKDEQQLELYSFEQELELILPPQESIYIFYIDALTASSDNIKADEKADLINVYLHLAKQVARIYSGEAEQLENSDILMRFEIHDQDDNHGINALCAAMLFNLLYKGFNQSRIKGFQPVLSLQMAIARGHHSRFNLVKEEAHFLTRTTHSNDLISHTALTEAPTIKETLLENADIRREDEDKVLLLKLTAKHQALLQKQANHLLTKIFKK